MHQAPAVSYPVGPCRFRTGLYAVLALLGALCWLAWVHAQGWHVPQSLGAGLYVVMLAWQIRLARQPAQGWLHWREGQWLWEAHAHPPHQLPQPITAVRPALDWQSGLLLALQGERVPRWLWLEQRQSPAKWLALRRAVWGP